MRRAVFVDRDGVINRAFVRNGRPYPPRSVEELEVLPEVPAAVDRLRQAGLLVIVVTNQPDIARGSTTREAVDRINQKMAARVEVDEVLVCPHDDADGCTCRKPQPGMLVDTAARLAIDLAGSFMVGDRWRDIEAGRSAGCRTAFIDRGYDERTATAADVVVGDLPAAVNWILSPVVASARSTHSNHLVAES